MERAAFSLYLRQKKKKSTSIKLVPKSYLRDGARNEIPPALRKSFLSRF